MKITKNILIIISLLLITSVITFVIFKKIKNKKEVEIEEVNTKEGFNNDDSCYTRGSYDPTDLLKLKNLSEVITKDDINIILGNNINNTTHKTIGGTWEELIEKKLEDISSWKINVKDNPSLGKNTVGCLLGKFIILKQKNDTYSVFFKNVQGFVNNVDNFKTFDTAINATLKKDGDIRNKIGKLNDSKGRNIEVLPISSEDIKEFLKKDDIEKIDKLNKNVSENKYSCVFSLTSDDFINKRYNKKECNKDGEILKKLDRILL